MKRSKIDVSEAVDALQELGADAKKQISKEIKKQNKKAKRRGRVGGFGVILVIAAIIFFLLSGFGKGLFGGNGNSLFGGKGNSNGDGDSTKVVSDNVVTNAPSSSTNPTDSQNVISTDDANSKGGDTQGGFTDGKLTIKVNNSDVYFGDEKLDSVESLNDKLSAIDRTNLPEIFLEDDHAIMSVYDRAEEILKNQELAYNGD